MKTLNENVNRMLNLMGSKKIITHNLINEQSAAWSNVEQQKGGQGDGYKVISKDYPSVPLIDPNTGNQWAIDVAKVGEVKWEPVYIGAGMTMSYSENGKRGKEFDLSEFFNYYIVFFITKGLGVRYEDMRKSGVLVDENKKGGVYIWHTQGRKLSTQKFMLKNQIVDLKSTERIYPISDLNDKNRDLSKSMNLSRITELSKGFPSNIYGYAPSLISKINTDLDTYGYPQLPKNLTLGFQNV